MTDDVRQRLAEHVRLNPDTSAVAAVAAVGANPEKWKDVVAGALDASDPVAALRNADTDRREVDPSDAEKETPTPGAGKTPIHDDETEADSTDDAADDEVDKYRRIYLDAAERAGREPWEPVEESALREALAAEGFTHLLENGELFNIRRWQCVDLADDDEPPRRRWYYASGNEPRPDEFRRFDQLLTENAPDDYQPHYFRVAKASKDPATQFGGWKTDEARLTVSEAVDWMEQGGNIGIAARGKCESCGGERGDCPECGGEAVDDALVNVDIDDDEETTPDDVPESLRIRSRSRSGFHTPYFEADDSQHIPNIPTDEFGEIRSNWQYVVAPGSFVASTAEEIPDDADDPGYYTIEHEAAVAEIDYDELPDVFHEAAEAAEQSDDGDDSDSATADHTSDDFDADDREAGSAVFDVDADELVSSRFDSSDRFSSIFHDSSTGANMSVSNGKVHCWRHGVAHGGLQALAVLSDVPHVKCGCKEIGKAHSNSGAGTNRLKGDWKLVWAAWHEAKRRGAIPDDDPIPYSTLVNLAVADDFVGEDDLVGRSTETGEIVDDDSDVETYTALPPGTYNDALQHVRDEYDLEPGREPAAGRGDTEADADSRSDPRERVATVDMRRAWEAAGRVTPEQLDDDLGLTTTDDGTGWLAGGDRITDVVRAVAVADGRIDTPDDEIDDYPAVYTTAREQYGAPLPRYYTTADAIAEFDAVLDVIGEATFFDLNTDALNSEITAVDDEVGGDAVRALDPAWRDSESGESVLVFDSGAIWDADTERVIDVLRFVALDSGRIDSPGESIEGEAFTETYQLARTEYGAPLPRWEPATDGSRQLTPQLPAGEELVDAVDFDGIDDDALGDAREAVEELLADRLADSDEPTVITSLPATGKTTGTIKNAADHPLSYLAPRKELQKQALSKAADWNVDAEVLPVFCDKQVREDILDAAVSHVRNAGKDRLRDRWAVLMNALAAVGGEGAAAPDADDLFTEPDDDEVDLDRPTCETARGDHGPAWALAVHIARRLGYTPREIHQQASGLFGAPLPCEAGDNNQCEYSDGWKRVTDADAPADLLVGSYVHAHVESVRTHYDHDTDGNVERTPRAVVLDEFPGDAFVREFDESAVDHATWLARSLVDEVEDRRDMRAADLHTDKWVRAWLDGRGDEAIPTTIRTLERFGALFDAREAAGEIRAEVDSRTLETLGLADPLAAVEYDDAADAFDDLAAAVDSVTPEQRAAGVARWADEAVREPLAVATIEGDSEPTIDAVGSDDALPESGDLRALVDQAAAAVDDASDEAAAAVDAAITALRGGRDGCRRLAAWADDGYAHPDAHHLLTADMTPTGEAETTTDDAVAVGRRLQTDSWAFDDAATDGTVLDHVETGPRSTVVADRNDHGALLHTPPSRQSGGGGEVPLVGLDATGRAELWSTALGESVRTADIHTTDSQRAEFLETALSLRVIQAADRPRPYEGDPSTKDTDGDVALLEAIADEYAGIEAPRSREEAAATIGSPAVITTKGVRELLETDSRLDDTVAEFENYGNITGANDLGDHQLAAILGSQHYGDDAVERFCALAGEQVNTDRAGGRGAALDYENALANTYLKHMRDDQTMQAILRFARGDSGATVVARTSALRDDLPVVGRGQVVETWSDTATKIARRYRRLGGEFTIGDVADAVDVTRRQVRRVLAELVEAGYLRRLSKADGKASVFQPAAAADPGAGEVALPSRNGAVDAEAGHDAHNQYYTWNVRVRGRADGDPPVAPPADARTVGAPPSPAAVGGDPPPE